MFRAKADFIAMKRQMSPYTCVLAVKFCTGSRVKVTNNFPNALRKTNVSGHKMILLAKGTQTEGHMCLHDTCQRTLRLYKDTDSS